MFPDRRDSVGDRCGVAYMAALDGNGAPVEGVLYQSSAAGAALSGAQSEGQELIVISDSDSSSDNSTLPMYPCTQCDKAMVLGGGGTLLCTTCWSRQVFSIGDSVALLRLCTNGYNHQQETIIGLVLRYCDNQYRVLLIGEIKPIAVCLVNIHLIYTAIFSLPGYRDKP